MHFEGAEQVLLISPSIHGVSGQVLLIVIPAGGGLETGISTV